MATERKPKRGLVHRAQVPALDQGREFPELDPAVHGELAAGWGDAGFLQWRKDLHAGIVDLMGRLPKRTALTAAERWRLIETAKAGAQALKELMHHLADDAGLAAQLFQQDSPAYAVKRLSDPLFEWLALLGTATFHNDDGDAARLWRESAQRYLQDLEGMRAEGVVLSEVVEARALLASSAIAPRLKVPTLRAMPPAVLAFARALAEDARQRPLIDYGEAVAPTASRTCWFVQTLEWVIAVAQLERYGVTSGSWLAERALKPD